MVLQSMALFAHLSSIPHGGLSRGDQSGYPASSMSRRTNLKEHRSKCDAARSLEIVVKSKIFSLSLSLSPSLPSSLSLYGS